ncbi:MAG: response regulator transcription factor [Firmicutes bacterium]|nr:response regulator transcription factor [Bacillota bacterium]NBI64856.1 DNA-binding response regulator [Clostridiales bacterium]
MYDSLAQGAHYDLIFLDIEFRQMNGIDVGKKIRDELRNDCVQIVFISAKREYAMELFSVRPMNFLVKPVSEQAILDNLEQAMALSRLYDSYFEFRFDSENYRVPYGDILYFESSNRMVRIYTKYGEKTLYGKLNEIEKNAPIHFIRIHQSYLINCYYVTYWKADEVEISRQVKLSISRSYQKKVRKVLLQEP